MKELLFSVGIKDCRVDTFRSGGKGGQNQNKRDTGVRVVHEPSGAVGEAREERSQLLNKRKAFTKMAESQKFKMWANLVAYNAMHKLVAKTLEQRVEEQMQPENIRVETWSNEGWKEEPRGIRNFGK